MYHLAKLIMVQRLIVLKICDANGVIKQNFQCRSKSKNIFKVPDLEERAKEKSNP